MATPDEKEKKETSTDDTTQTVKEKKSPSKKLLFIFVILIIMIIGGGVGYWYIIANKKRQIPEQKPEVKIDEKRDEKREEKFDKKNVIENSSVSLALDDFVVDLQSQTGKAYFLKAKIVLEMKNGTGIQEVSKHLHRIRDVCQIYFRTLRPSDLSGNVGLQIVREDLILRINNIIYPLVIENVLFTEFIVN